MAHNVEIKARLHDPEALRSRLREMDAEGPTTLEQEDIFFHSRNGRLKLRKAAPRDEFVYYERADTNQPTESQYMKVALEESAALEAMLSVALEVRGTVRKRRDLYQVGATRVHLDDVEGLGSFLELEVELDAGTDVEEGEAEAYRLMGELGVDTSDLIAEAYIDLLEAKEQEDQ